ncbi:unnamed protein product, partial [Anisakis simplex]|uniref:EB domain-containing protein n=1 Tax=Anisakis simplex TaxID=6269 RepID=A0A0M3JCA5_ANISI
MLLRGSTHSSSSFKTPTFAPYASITRTPSNTQRPIEAAETPTDSPFTIIGHHIISQVSHPAASTQRKTSHQMRSAGHISAENQRRVVNTERLSKQGSQIQSRSDQVIPNGRNSTSDVSNDAYLKSDQANVVDEIVKPADEVTVVNQIQTVKSRQSPTPVGVNLRSDVEEGSRSMASAQSVYHVTRCRDDRECSGGTRCARGYCLCPVYHTLIDGKCHSANSATTISAATLG